ncbi:hypothetical protein Lser_V15G22065 [Lactuca serriola]
MATSSMLLTNEKAVEQQSITDHGSSFVKIININDDISENGTLLCDEILDKDAPRIDSPADDKLTWLRTQIIGGNAEIHTPFGKRKLTYADHTASSRCLQYIEDYIIKNVLPFYGNFIFSLLFLFLFLLQNHIYTMNPYDYISRTDPLIALRFLLFPFR